MSSAGMGQGDADKFPEALKILLRFSDGSFRLANYSNDYVDNFQHSILYGDCWDIKKKLF